MNAPKRTRAGSPIRLDSNPQRGIGRNGRLTEENANRLVVGLEELDKGFDQCPPGRFLEANEGFVLSHAAGGASGQDGGFNCGIVWRHLLSYERSAFANVV
jgi:hypothetical protein